MDKRRSIAGMLLLVLLLIGCGDNSVNITKGMNSIRNLDYQSALGSFEEATLQGEDEQQIARGMGIAYMGLADYEAAASCFEEALSHSNGLVESIDYDINYYLAAAYTKSGRYQEAEAVYNAILALKGNEEDAYFLRGNVRMELGDYEDAKLDFDKVVSLNPRDYDRLIQICQVLENHGYKDAGQLYLRAALQDGESQMSTYDKGRIYYYLEEYQKACQALEEAKGKGGAEAYLYLGMAYEATGDYNYASSVYNSWVSQYGEHAQMYNQLGLCEMAKGNYESALSSFQAGMKVENNEIAQTLAFNEIIAYEYLGEYKKAAVLMEGYLSTYPDDEAAQREYGFLKTR